MKNRVYESGPCLTHRVCFFTSNFLHTYICKRDIYSKMSLCNNRRASCQLCHPCLFPCMYFSLFFSPLIPVLEAPFIVSLCALTRTVTWRNVTRVALLSCTLISLHVEFVPCLQTCDFIPCTLASLLYLIYCLLLYVGYSCHGNLLKCDFK